MHVDRTEEGEIIKMERGSMELAGLRIHEGFHERLKKGGFSGRVHSVFQKAVNIMDEEEVLYTLLSTEMDEGPMALQVNAANLSALMIRPGDPVNGDADRLTLGPVRFTLRDVPVYELLQEEYVPSPFLSENLTRARAVLETRKEKEQSAYEVEMNRVLKERVSSLKQAFLEENTDGILSASYSLVGLGPGLTPSGDDVLLGILTILNRKNHPYEQFRPLFEEIVDYARMQTNVLSYYGLRRAYDGFIRKDITDFASALLKKEKFQQELERILMIGHSSGQDITEGILMMLEIIETRKKECNNGN